MGAQSDGVLVHGSLLRVARLDAQTPTRSGPGLQGLKFSQGQLMQRPDDVLSAWRC
jgi:hypothetical protein